MSDVILGNDDCLKLTNDMGRLLTNNNGEKITVWMNKPPLNECIIKLNTLAELLSREDGEKPMLYIESIFVSNKFADQMGCMHMLKNIFDISWWDWSYFTETKGDNEALMSNPNCTSYVDEVISSETYEKKKKETTVLADFLMFMKTTADGLCK